MDCVKDFTTRDVKPDEVKYETEKSNIKADEVNFGFWFTAVCRDTFIVGSWNGSSSSVSSFESLLCDCSGVFDVVAVTGCWGGVMMVRKGFAQWADVMWSHIFSWLSDQSPIISRCLFSLTHGSVLCKEPEENRFKALMLVVGNVWFTAAAEVGEVTLMFRCRTGSLTSLNTCWAPVRCRCSDSFLWSSFKSACALSSSPAAPSPACRSI